MFTYLPTVAGLVLLWFFSGLGVSYFLTRGTPLFRYFVWLSIFGAQILIILVSTALGTFETTRVSLSLVIFANCAGILLSAYVIRKLGFARLIRFARYRMTIPLLAVIVACIFLQVAPCVDRGKPCFVSHINHEYLNYSSNAQWIAGQAPGERFETNWRELGHTRFAGEILLAYVSRTLAVPPIYGINALHALLRVQYLACAIILFHFLYPGVGLKRRWGAWAVGFTMLISALEWQNFLLAFLAHHATASALAVMCITMLFRPRLRIAVLQTAVMLYIAIAYIEI